MAHTSRSAPIFHTISLEQARRCIGEPPRELIDRCVLVKNDGVIASLNHAVELWVIPDEDNPQPKAKRFALYGLPQNVELLVLTLSNGHCPTSLINPEVDSQLFPSRRQ